MPLISIIVPVYNAEKYLEKCVDSITSQTLHDVEIILVDDCSTDESGRLCDEYALKDSRIRVIHFDENRMQGEARNAGLNLASGDYIGFVDADDYIEPDTYESVYSVITSHSADICMFGIKVVYETGTVSFTNGIGRVSVFGRTSGLRSFLNNENIITDTCVNKLYSKKLFEEVRFKKGIIYEDNEITFRLLEKADKSVHSGLCKYNYIKRKNSTTQKAFRKENLSIIPINRERIECIKESYPDLLEISIIHYVTNLICTLNLLITCGSFHKYADSARLLRHEIVTYTGICKLKLGLRRRCQVFLICFSLRLYKLIWAFFYLTLRLSYPR